MEIKSILSIISSILFIIYLLLVIINFVTNWIRRKKNGNIQ